MAFQPTLPLRGATGRRSSDSLSLVVSTHAPLAGSDTQNANVEWRVISFNPRSPCGERRGRPDAGHRAAEFQPTLPLRGATHRLARVGSLRRQQFQPTLPLRRPRTARGSTHAPLAGSDQPCRVAPRRRSFNPRSPCGERPVERPPSVSYLVRVSARRSPCGERREHAWHRGRSPRQCFNPRSPCGERRHVRRDRRRDVGVSTHAPLAGSDTMHCCCSTSIPSFNPRSPCGERR